MRAVHAVINTPMLDEMAEAITRSQSLIAFLAGAITHGMGLGDSLDTLGKLAVSLAWIRDLASENWSLNTSLRSTLMSPQEVQSIRSLNSNSRELAARRTVASLAIYVGRIADLYGGYRWGDQDLQIEAVAALVADAMACVEAICIMHGITAAGAAFNILEKEFNEHEQSGIRRQDAHFPAQHQG